MNRPHRVLLILDGLINLALGVLLCLAPFGMAGVLGVPQPSSYLYSTVLGGVLLGIGLSLLWEARGPRRTTRGLGMGGAIIINFCGAGALLVWLVLSPQTLPMRGQLLLGSIVGIVFLVGVVELAMTPKQPST